MYLQSSCENQLLALPCPSCCLYGVAWIPLDWFLGNFKVGVLLKVGDILILIEITEKKQTLHIGSCSYVFMLYVIMHCSLLCKTGGNASCLYLHTFFYFVGISTGSVKFLNILQHIRLFATLSVRRRQHHSWFQNDKLICGCNIDQL
jgi:hypothetical protein